jgi:hypothetical protein
MTEAEYIRTIRDVAERYLEVIRDPGDFMNGEGIRRIRHWTSIKEKLSAHTAIKLCDLWLEGNGGDASLEGHSESVAGDEALSDNIGESGSLRQP